MRIGLALRLLPHGALRGHFPLIAVEALALALKHHYVFQAFALLHGNLSGFKDTLVLM